jgi:hypothetical protein
MTGYTLNAAIGLQVIMGSLITGLSAASKNASSERIDYEFHHDSPQHL